MKSTKLVIGDTVKIVDPSDFYFGKLTTIVGISFEDHENGPIYTVELISPEGNAAITSSHRAEKLRKQVKTKNIMSNKEIWIDEEKKGGVCDPGTERYWSM